MQAVAGGVGGPLERIARSGQGGETSPTGGRPACGTKLTCDAPHG